MLKLSLKFDYISARKPEAAALTGDGEAHVPTVTFFDGVYALGVAGRVSWVLDWSRAGLPTDKPVTLPPPNAFVDSHTNCE